jgi:predicted MFS family arabinose efflux permease
MLIGVGSTAFIANPAFLALVQTYCKQNRSLASGVYMSGNLMLRAIGAVIVGILADHFGLRPIFFGSTWLVLLALPLIFMLPQR